MEILAVCIGVLAVVTMFNTMTLQSIDATVYSLWAKEDKDGHIKRRD